MAHSDYYGFKKICDIPCDKWSFLPRLNVGALDIQPERGTEIYVADEDYPITVMLEKHLKEATFDCVFQTSFSAKDLIPLATNKYNSVVAAAFAPAGEEGAVFLLPNIQDKGLFLVEFLRDFLPGLVPKLFPQSEAISWAKQSVYEFAEIKSIEDEIEQMVTATNEKVEALRQHILEERAVRQYLVDLLATTGTDLVEAVKKGLKVLGFEAVIDVDENEGQGIEDGFLAEDLRIEDNDVILLIEVKGVSGTPSDNEAMQVQKHVTHRMRELNNTSITGLTIINHQRHLPPLDRENEKPFRDLILSNARQGRIGLLTTWDFVRLIRSFLANGWSPENVKPIFFRHGRIEPIPEHYEYVGKIQDFWEKAGVVSVLVEGAIIKHGDRLGYELPVEFREQDANSLQMNNRQVEEAVAGETVAIKNELIKEEARKGTRVFRVNSEHN